MDYLGESGIGAWGLGTPAQAAQAEQKTKIATTLKILADRHFLGMVQGTGAKPAAMTASWTWPGHEGKELQVEVHSGAEKVRLFLNGKLIGEQDTGREQQYKATFPVRYQPGTLKAVGVRADRAVAESVLTTAGEPVKLRLTADRATIQADGQDLSFVTVQAADLEGRLQPAADQEVQFSVDGPAVIAAVGNADGQDTAAYQGTRRKLYHGRALVVIRSTGQAGPIRLVGTVKGLGATIAMLQAKATGAQPELR
jgi:beta-galactosidase